jgi:adhesin/invasin
MISRRFAVIALVVAAASAAMSACQKVPLLAPSGSKIVLTAAATTLPSNGSTDIIASVLEASGTPPQNGTLVTFTTTLGTIQPAEATTQGGRAIVKFVAGPTSGTATITASSGGATVGADGAVKIAVGSAGVDNVALSASPSNVSSAGGTVTLTAVANDVNGNRIVGVPVAFSATAGQLGAATVLTDNSGVATTTLFTTRQSEVTAAIGRLV